MDIERLIADETARERALYERVKAAEREMEPFKRRYEALRGEWSEAYNQVKTLTKMRELLAAHATGTSADAAVLDADRRELGAQGELWQECPVCGASFDWPSGDTMEMAPLPMHRGDNSLAESWSDPEICKASEQIVRITRRELGAGEPAKVETAPACLPWGNRGTERSAS